MLKTEAVKKYLDTYASSDYSKRYSPEMEVQLNVAQDNGVRVRGEYLGVRWVGWKDEKGNLWKSFRIPWNANKEPNYKDSEIKFNLEEHCEGIGMTGWNWVKQTSLWFGYDFDSIANHKEGLSDEQLEEIKEAVFKIPWVTLTSSTSGKGYHVYVDLSEPVETSNHTEHAALARSVLSLLSIATGYSLEASVDACGMVLWVWHRKQEGTNGLTTIKQGEPLSIQKLPTNWKEHISVTAKRALKIRGNLSNENEFQELYSSQKHVALNDEHRRLLKWMNEKAEKDFWWDFDHNMLVCHTFDLKKAHVDLLLKGIFETNSSGSSTQNSYAFPLESGAWVVRRHSLKVREHPSWRTDPSGWTRCILNDVPDFITCAQSFGGIENSRGEYVFHSCSEGMKALKHMGIELDIPEALLSRGMSIIEKADKLVIGVVREARDTNLVGFLPNKKGDKWERVEHYKKKKKETYSPDFLIRHTVANDSEAGWWINVRNSWIQHNRSNVISVLLAQEGTSRGDIDVLLSKSILNPWELVNIPFVEDYPGDRRWNKTAATLSCKPIQGDHDTWSSVLENVGKSLDSYVLEDEWCIRNAINKGSEYLLVWIANMFQRPEVPLPYLFFYGPQNSGKSSLHEALALLIKRGYARADQALVNQQGFNSEIANAVLCVVEETDLKAHKDAGNRIKDWVTGKTISINTKYKTVYDIKNTTHWMQCANDASYCPIFPGDTRIVVIWVDMPSKEIPKNVLFDRLEDEKEAFLDLVLKIELPDQCGRLGVPCISSKDKEDMQLANLNDLEVFMRSKVVECKGNIVFFEDFWDAFQDWLPDNKKNLWTKNRTSRLYPITGLHVKGRCGRGGNVALGNIALNREVKPNPFKIIISETGSLEQRMEDHD